MKKCIEIREANVSLRLKNQFVAALRDYQDIDSMIQQLTLAKTKHEQAMVNILLKLDQSGKIGFKISTRAHVYIIYKKRVRIIKSERNRK